MTLQTGRLVPLLSFVAVNVLCPVPRSPMHNNGIVLLHTVSNIQQVLVLRPSCVPEKKVGVNKDDIRVKEALNKWEINQPEGIKQKK